MMHPTRIFKSPELKSAEVEFEVPLKRNKNGVYSLYQRHIGGRDFLRKLGEKKVKEGYVYFIRMQDSNYYKIGVSTNPEKRLKAIDSYLPVGFEILALNKVTNPFGLENEIIKVYKNQILKNEWFLLNTGQAKEIMINLHNAQVNESREAKTHE